MNPVKTEPKPQEFQNFDAAMGKLMAVPRNVFQKRLQEFKDKPGTRGPKRKVKPSASPDPAV